MFLLDPEAGVCSRVLHVYTGATLGFANKMVRTISLCSLGLVTGDEICRELPSYRLEARSADGRRVSLQLCSNHVHRAWHLAQMMMRNKYPGETVKVRSIHLHQIKRLIGASAEAAS